MLFFHGRCQFDCFTLVRRVNPTVSHEVIAKEGIAASSLDFR